jgi:Na+/glutamate symporter
MKGNGKREEEDKKKKEEERGIRREKEKERKGKDSKRMLKIQFPFAFAILTLLSSLIAAIFIALPSFVISIFVVDLVVVVGISSLKSSHFSSTTGVGMGVSMRVEVGMLSGGGDN